MRVLARGIMLLGTIYGMIALAGGYGSGGAFIAFASVPLWYFCAVLAHEAGHFATGAMRGMGATTVTAYPIEIQLRPFRCRWVPKAERKPLGGFVQFEAGKCRLRDYLVMILGGPLANLLLAVVAILTAIRVGWPSVGSGEAVGLAAVSSGMSVANLIPHGNSDGAKLLNLWRWLRTA